MNNLPVLLRSHGIQPTVQRLAVAECVLGLDSHPTADEVVAAIRVRYPTISRATVYNTLNLFVRSRLLRTQSLKDGTVLFDPNVGPHHHFVDEETGRVFDVAWDAVSISGLESLEGLEVRDVQVVMRGRLRSRK
jgi:Fur family iron response transcriptional regulator